MLLLLFVRVLIPEQELLQLHNHDHTEDLDELVIGLKVDKKHQHCPIDELINAPFTPAPKVVIQTLDFFTFTDTYSANHSCIWKFTFPNNTDLRGPPVA